jgi:predicted AAA+ superfamily ATPase
MIEREIENELLTLTCEYPVVTILGPRQSGKTTLATKALPTYEYCNLESPDNRSQAIQDPKAFLSQFKGPVILDEVQRVPELLSYIQVAVDQKRKNGQFILTGSHQLELKASISQSLAGRTAILQLLPFSIVELERGNIRFSTFQEYVLHGFLPRVYDQKQRPRVAYANYYQTYVERDVRQLINLKDASQFERFMKLLAGRIGQLVDYNSLANDVGVDAKTIKNWLSILEASFIIYKLSPFFENFGKRVIKSPKYYFVDVGLLAFLLGLEEIQHVSRDPLVGSIFENLVVIDCLKARLNQARPANLYFYRDSSGREIDLIFQDGQELTAIEIKSTSTYNPSLVTGLTKFREISQKVARSFLVYNGEERALGPQLTAISFLQASRIFHPSK